MSVPMSALWRDNSLTLSCTRFVGVAYVNGNEMNT